VYSKKSGFESFVAKITQLTIQNKEIKDKANRSLIIHCENSTRGNVSTGEDCTFSS